MNPTHYAITQELETLRERYKREPDRRAVIELQAKVLKLALDASTPKPVKKTAEPENELVKAANDYLM